MRGRKAKQLRAFARNPKSPALAYGQINHVRTIHTGKTREVIDPETLETVVQPIVVKVNFPQRVMAPCQRLTYHRLKKACPKGVRPIVALRRIFAQELAK